MTATASLQAQTIERWTPPDVDPLAVLEKLRQWQPFDGDAFMYVVGTVLEYELPRSRWRTSPSACAASRMAWWTSLSRLPRRTTPPPSSSNKARAVRAEEAPGGFWQAVGHLRRMALALETLHEHLVDAKCVKEAA
ncbi:hypothetical protein ACFV19_31300 [Streptomyces griseoluteus]|uniref:hypothetical protein n=1 Tax=Streptomyces griseoluteus TaxID=29306 RepID=UPI0036B758F9